MEKQLTEKQEKEWGDLIYWWEHLSDGERDKLMNRFGHGWKGSNYERYTKVKKMYREYLRLQKGCLNSSQA